MHLTSSKEEGPNVERWAHAHGSGARPRLGRRDVSWGFRRARFQHLSKGGTQLAWALPVPSGQRGQATPTSGGMAMCVKAARAPSHTRGPRGTGTGPPTPGASRSVCRAHAQTHYRCHLQTESGLGTQPDNRRENRPNPRGPPTALHVT